MRRSWTATLVVLCLAVADPAVAQPRREPTAAQIDEARGWFDTGTERYRQGEWRGALEAFRHAYDLTGSAEILFNIGQCADRLRQDRDALQAFRLYLERLPRAPDRSSVEARIRVLRAEIARQEEVVRDREAARQERERRERERRDRGLGGEGAAGTTDEDGSVLGEWWFWTLAVVVVAGGVTAGVLLTQDNEPIPGSDGGTIVTLRLP